MKARALLVVGIGVLAFAAASMAAPIFQDDFEGGVYAGSGGKWTAANTTYLMTWATDQAKSPTHSAKTTLSGARIYANLGQEVATPTLEFWLYDDSMTRSFAQIAGYTGAGYNQGTNEALLAIGKYNSVTMPGETWGNYYSGRVTYGTTVGWFMLNGPGSPTRSAGWHKFKVEVTSGGTAANFYVDGILSRTITGLTVRNYDSVTLGFGTSSTSNGNSWYDDVSVTPEPATMALLGLGALPLIRRRRA